MWFCSNCGVKLNDDTNFCTSCGNKNEKSINLEFRKKEICNFEVYKCPYCETAIDSFVSNCPFCGKELTRESSKRTIKGFAKRLETANTYDKKCAIIRNFIIPNDKEGIFEFAFLARTNLLGDETESLFDPWIDKFDECYQKGKMILSRSDFYEFEKFVKETNSEIIEQQKIRRAKNKRVQRKRNVPRRIMALLIIVTCTCLILGMFTFVQKFKKHQEVIIGESFEYFQGQSYDVVKEYFEEKGFETIESIEVYNSAIKSENRNQVTEVLIDGKKRFYEKQVFSKKSKVIIKYHTDAIEIGCSNQDFEGKYYEDVVEVLKSKGFVNVKLRSLGDLITGWIYEEGEVSKVLIGGKNSFDDTDKFYPDEPIIIEYHSK